MDNRDNNSSDLLSQVKKEQERIEKALEVTSWDQYKQVFTCAMSIGYNLFVLSLLDCSTIFNYIMLIPIFLLSSANILGNLVIVIDPIPYIKEGKQVSFLKEELNRFRNEDVNKNE